MPASPLVRVPLPFRRLPLDEENFGLSLRIWTISDLHLELSRWDLPPKEQWPEFDVMVVAGDLTTRAERGVRWLQERISDRPVIYVIGNHERYGEDCERTVEKAREAAFGSNVRVLECDFCTIGGIEFLGATMWTNFALFGADNVRRCMDYARYRMNDYRRIRVNGYTRRFTPEGALLRHERTIAFFRERARLAPDVARVIVTHHSPDPADATNDLISAAYCSALEPSLMRELNCRVWISGHVHLSRDRLSAARLVGNPKGYGPYAGEPSNAWQNPNFDPRLIVEVDA
jgi:Icc-related predicted phosphoesterase